MNWSDFFVSFAQDPLKALSRFFEVVSRGFVDNWWQVFIAVAVLYAARYVTFSLIDFFVPRNIQERSPFWSKGKIVRSWRDALYGEAIKTRNFQRTRTVVSLAKSVLDPFMMVLSFFIIFGMLGMTMTSKSGGIILGGLSLALGLGFQGLVKDIIAGITVLLSDAYAVGDFVDAQFGASGVVKHIGIRLTALEAPDGTIWYVRHSELPKIGNMTASQAVIVSDVVLEWCEDDKIISSANVFDAERKLDEVLKELSGTLESIDKASQTRHEDLPLRNIVSVLPDLVPSMTTETLTDMRAITESDLEDTGKFRRAMERIPGRVPVFLKIETLGLVNSSRNTVTLRLRVTLPPTASRAQAMSILRRAIFEKFSPLKIVPSFSDVPDSELPVLDSFEDNYKKLKKDSQKIPKNC